MDIPAIIEENKPLYATYSTMALMNVQTILNHIQNIVGIDGKLEDKSENYWEHPIIKYLENGRVLEKKLEIQNRILKSFPFLNIMAENQRILSNKKENTERQEINSSDILFPLGQCLRVLKKYRDFTCHYYFSDNCWTDGSNFLRFENILSFIVDKYYDVALRKVKERFNYDTEHLKFIHDERKKKHGKGYIPDYDFFLSLLSTNGDVTGKNHLSGIGVVLLICLFLEKKYINIFLSKLPIYGEFKSESEEARIIRRSMAINSIILPKERITSEKGRMSVALDMLNELKRCPKELFETLSWEDQNRFRIISSDYNEVLQLRSMDRFAQLSLQYIDVNNLFKKIRFHVNMGKLRYLFAPQKICIDNQVRVRVLEHNLNGYGRLGEMEEFRKQPDGVYGESSIKIKDNATIKRDDDNPDNYPYIVDVGTHYLLNNNKIEFSFTNQKITPEIECKNNGKWYVYKTDPDCRMSVFELPAMMFHMHLLGSKKTEQLIEKTYSNYKRLFQAMSKGEITIENIDSYGIDRADMPQKVIDAINNVVEGKNYKSFVHQEVDKLLNETQFLRANIENDKTAVNSKGNKMGKRGFKQIKVGKLAEFLAKDIIKFQPTLGTEENYGLDRMTGMNFRVLQASIATYGKDVKFEEFKNIFTKARLIEINENKKHPFLEDALKKRPKNSIEFYEKYLEARENYLNRLKEKINNNVDVKLPFINKDRKKWLKRNSDFYKTIGEIYNEDLAIELPRQMFDAEIKERLKEIPEMEGVDYEKSNITYLIGEYLKRVYKDDFQKFYSLKRNYRYIDMLKCNKKCKTLTASYTTTSEREEIWNNRESLVAQYKGWVKKQNQAKRPTSDLDAILTKRISRCRNDFQKSEKTIRRYKVQDVLMFLMAKDVMKQNIEFSANEFRLQNIMPDSDRGILSKVVPITFKFERGGKKYTIHSDGMKLKNYGDFLALLNDKRLPSLIKILGSNEINKENLEKELDNYDTCRPSIMKIIIDFEKISFDKHCELSEVAKTQEHFDFRSLLKYLEEINDIDDYSKIVLQNIRNAFSHNQYPDKGMIEITTLPEIANHLKKMFGKYAQLEN